jgi:hypothetical protein
MHDIARTVQYSANLSIYRSLHEGFKKSWLQSYLVWGWVSPKNDEWRKSLALCLLCACNILSPPLVPGGEAHSLAGDGVGESQFRRLEKKLSTLPT